MDFDNPNQETEDSNQKEKQEISPKKDYTNF